MGVEREVAAPVEDPYRTELLLDQLRSLRTALTIVGVIAVAALAVAGYALLSEDEESDDGAAASRQQVADLADRVDALEADVKTRATKNQVSQLSDDVKALSGRVDKVAKQSQSAASSDDGGTDEQARSSIDELEQSVQTLSQDIKDLDRRVRDLEDQTSSNSPDRGGGRGRPPHRATARWITTVHLDAATAKAPRVDNESDGAPLSGRWQRLRAARLASQW